MEVLESVDAYLRDNAGLLTSRLVAALLILLAAFIANRLARRAFRKYLGREGHSARSMTLLPIVQTLLSISIVGTGVVIALEQFGFNLTAVIAGAGVLGLAIGFGGQELVKDVISGFFMIFDGVIETGDFVTTDAITGQVEEIGIRVTRIRSYDGKLWYVPNGRIQVVGNMSRGWVRAIAEVGLAYEEDVGRGLQIMQQVGDAWAADNPELCVERPEAQGVVGLNTSNVGVRLVGRVAPAQHWAVEREWRRRIKAAFDEAGIEVPLSRHVMYLKREDESPRVRAS